MFLSIHIVSNNYKAIEDSVQNIEETSLNPSEIEVVVVIDKGDLLCINSINFLSSKTKLNLRYFETTKIKCFDDIWKPFNDSLPTTHPEAYFVSIFNDEFRFKTQGWDEILKQYVGYYKDDIFRIRLSRYRFRNYSDFWECVFAPDSLAFYTKKWLDFTGVHFHTDTWQQLVSFYLINSRKFDHIQYNRDIPEPFIECAGEGAGVGLTLLESRDKNKSNVTSWFYGVSFEMQEKAKYAASLLQTQIILHDISNDDKNITHNFLSSRKPPVFSQKEISEISFKNNEEEKRIEFFYKKNMVYTISYKVNKLYIFLINNFRKINYPYYSGGGEEVFRKNIINAIYTYYRIRKYGDFGYKEFVKTQQPKLFKKPKLRIIWTALKSLIAVFKICRILLLKITFSEKYYRLAQRRIHKKNAK